MKRNATFGRLSVTTFIGQRPHLSHTHTYCWRKCVLSHLRTCSRSRSRTSMDAQQPITTITAVSTPPQPLAAELIKLATSLPANTLAALTVTPVAPAMLSTGIGTPSTKEAKPMFVGANLHNSEDGRPLCSYSAKTCNQRRMEGYAFCIKHVLEDPSCPFKQCAYISKQQQRQCSNAIPRAETNRMYGPAVLRSFSPLLHKMRVGLGVPNVRLFLY
jgi:hypothetical protein